MTTKHLKPVSKKIRKNLHNIVCNVKSNFCLNIALIDIWYIEKVQRNIGNNIRWPIIQEIKRRISND